MNIETEWLKVFSFHYMLFLNLIQVTCFQIVGTGILITLFSIQFLLEIEFQQLNSLVLPLLYFMLQMLSMGSRSGLLE